MYNISFSIFTISLILILLLMILFLTSKKKNNNFHNLSTFECGFNPISLARMPFSIHFFMMTIIFLIFDVEISLVMPLILCLSNSSLIYWFSLNSFFFYLLLFGLFHEWNQNMLKWTN
uniref:NADH-ubiquinone oxidoreductase chain 3 n=1 Tax=Marilia sp. XG-2021 TaxID=2996736 RepID=A0A9E8RT57_9NEOP|nr:NADH dehydrogenase subunit 3 [Marilia sp. XG-2021]